MGIRKIGDGPGCYSLEVGRGERVNERVNVRVNERILDRR